MNSEKTLSPEEIRIIIAEFEGWKFHPAREPFGVYRIEAHWVSPNGTDVLPPNYLDENEIRRVWRRLPSDLYEKAEAELRRVFYTTNGISRYMEHRDYLLATATQLCKALVKALGKWREQ